MRRYLLLAATTLALSACATVQPANAYTCADVIAIAKASGLSHSELANKARAAGVTEGQIKWAASCLAPHRVTAAVTHRHTVHTGRTKVAAHRVGKKHHHHLDASTHLEGWHDGPAHVADGSNGGTVLVMQAGTQPPFRELNENVVTTKPGKVDKPDDKTQPATATADKPHTTAATKPARHHDILLAFLIAACAIFAYSLGKWGTANIFAWTKSVQATLRQRGPRIDELERSLSPLVADLENFKARVQKLEQQMTAPAGNPVPPSTSTFVPIT